MPSKSNQNPSTKSVANKPNTFFGLKPSSDVFRLVAGEISKRGLQLPDGKWAHGALKIVLEECVRGHLVRRTAKPIRRNTKTAHT